MDITETLRTFTSKSGIFNSAHIKITVVKGRENWMLNEDLKNWMLNRAEMKKVDGDNQISPIGQKFNVS